MGKKGDERHLVVVVVVVVGACVYELVTDAGTGRHMHMYAYAGKDRTKGALKMRGSSARGSWPRLCVCVSIYTASRPYRRCTRWFAVSSNGENLRIAFAPRGFFFTRKTHKETSRTRGFSNFAHPGRVHQTLQIGRLVCLSSLYLSLSALKLCPLLCRFLAFCLVFLPLSLSLVLSLSLLFSYCFAKARLTLYIRKRVAVFLRSAVHTYIGRRAHSGI